MTESEFTDHLTKNPFEGHEKPSPPVKPKSEQMGLEFFQKKNLNKHEIENVIKTFKKGIHTSTSSKSTSEKPG